jgi:hypothetical protein
MNEKKNWILLRQTDAVIAFFVDYKQKLNTYTVNNNIDISGQLNPKDISSVIVISDISAANVDGMTGKTEKQFQEYKKQLDKNVKSNTRFNDNDVDTGNITNKIWV